MYIKCRIRKGFRDWHRHPQSESGTISSNCVTQTDTFTYHLNDLFTTPPPSSLSIFFSHLQDLRSNSSSSLLLLFCSLPLSHSTMLFLPWRIEWVWSLVLRVGDRQTKTSPTVPALSQNAHPSICPIVCARAAGELKWSALGWGGEWACLLVSVREES